MDDQMKIHFLAENMLLKILLLNEKEWVNPIFAEREKCGEFHTLFPKLLEQPQKFYEYFRMNRDTFEYILNNIRPYIEKQSSFRKCISPEERLAVTLRYLSTGLAFRSLAFSYRIAHSTIAKIIYETCDAIWNCFTEKHMPVPTAVMLEQCAKDYEDLWNFPNCVGSIDGKHVRIKCPKLSGSKYFNYKTFHSLILQGLVDARYKFLSVDFGAYGRQSDSGVFIESNLYKQIEMGLFPFPQARQLPGTTFNLPYVILGDQGYPLKDYLMRPYSSGPATVPHDVEVYNYRHSRARRTVECAFGILVAKWRCLKTELQVDPKHIDKLVTAVCLLHNIIIDKEGINETMMHNINLEIVTSAAECVKSKRYNRAGREAYNIRDQFKAYFNAEGAVHFQYDKLNTYTI
ncbi:uncharacterized protein LOC131953030 [Physella acuta]|uniref:uncharacterized protein LOC131935467 n=1 Tax=Physella acuta TaxID=109671 RepID=UPI0027DBB56B|nr:uncharacterized protein LOC131935467 [Physella acuta]XP_059171994.1 uncharacterized protein LOC131953030 [Physella acuta]